MQEGEQGDSKKQHDKRNPEMTVCNDGFEHDLSLALQTHFSLVDGPEADPLLFTNLTPSPQSP
jgi:hypothetical protein